MGIVKVLAMPFSGFDFMHALQAAHAEHRALAPEAVSRVYTVFAAEGGVGKTTLAFNLAVAAAQLGSYPVALVDGSLQLAGRS
jgi:Mrp family chromosome partitioning ATPase